tara:strand:+ start:269 stop:1033 length:765 start_codon:yes stop_codon:yes gene_type:complete
MSEILTNEEVWAKLYPIDVSEWAKNKGNLAYLPWNQAVKLMMRHYPEFHYEFQDNELHPDGSMSVHCTVVIKNLAKRMWLPVMDYRNKALSNPNARDISDSKMRCLVKAVSMFGLGFHLFEGVVQPEDTWDDDKEEKNSIVGEIKESLDTVEKEESTEEEDLQEMMGVYMEASNAKIANGVWGEDEATTFVSFVLDVAGTFSNDRKSLKEYYDQIPNQVDYLKENLPKQYKALQSGFSKLKAKYLEEENKNAKS